MDTTPSTETNVYQYLDDWFLAHGFNVTPLGKLMPGRKWERTVGERHIEVVCSPRTRTKYQGEVSRMRYVGHEVAIEIKTPLHTRISLAPMAAASLGGVERFLRRKMDLHPLENAGEAYNHLRVNVHEDRWAREFLGLAEVQRHIRDFVLPADGRHGHASFSLQPGTVNFRMRRPLGEMSAELLGGIVSSLDELTDLAEACSPPSKQAKRTRIERMGRENPAKLLMIFFGALIGLSFLFVFLMIGLIMLGLEEVILFFVFGCVLLFAIWWMRRRK